MSDLDPSTIYYLTSQLQDLRKHAGQMNSNALRNEMISQAKDIIFALQTPEQHALQISADAMALVALRTVMRIGILDAIPLEGNISLSNLALKTGAQPAMIERLLRILVGARFISQDEYGFYAHTHISRGYMAGGEAGIWTKGVLYDTVFDIVHNYPLGYLDAHPKLIEPTDPNINPATWHWGYEGENIWQVFAVKKPELMADFQRGMAILSPLIPVTGYFDFSQLARAEGEEDRLAIVDVGGGVGSCLVDILKAHPDIKPQDCVLQDQEIVLQLARGNTELPKGVKLQAHDFFTEQKVKNAKAYFMRWIVHDYSDENATMVLKNIANVMGSDSRILLNEVVIPEQLEEGSLYAATLDMFMFCVGGKERTKTNFERILGNAGLKLVKIWHAQGTSQATIEAMLA